MIAGGSSSSVIAWPNGNGNNAASWAVSAGISAANPWKGVALYQNPSITNGVDMAWQSGTTLAVDGIVYFPNAQLTVSGQVVYGPTGCSKLVVGEFTLNGAVNLKQSATACAGMQVAQWSSSDSAYSQGGPYLPMIAAKHRIGSTDGFQTSTIGDARIPSATRHAAAAESSPPGPASAQ